MFIIPVIDLYAGNVVHAIAGQREAYKNIQTPLCHSSDPLLVIDALLSLYPFTTLYIADLDAIKDEGNNNKIISKFLSSYPDLCIWLDSGKSLYPLMAPTDRFRQIIASETGISDHDLLEYPSKRNAILSLDFSQQHFLGQECLLNNANAWPDDIIVMSLGRVGMNQGPDMARLQQIQSHAHDKHIYAAGGVRNDEDLADLDSQGFAGVLLASALHYGKISEAALERYSV